jgi:hypothetical protein
MLFAKDWVLSENPSEVDKFANDLNKNKITHDGKIMNSLASKILFLNNPEEIIPIDTLNKRALGAKSNCYNDFMQRIKLFKLESIEPLLSEVEMNFKTLKINFNKYRITRYTDKLLWTKGKK